MFSRKLLRWSVRLAVLLTLITLTVFVTDLWYDFLPPSIQTRLPMHPPDPIIVDIEIRSCNKLLSCDSSGMKWRRVPKDLYLGKSWTRQAYVYLKTVNENELDPGQEVVLNMAHGQFDLDDLSARIPEEVFNDLLPIVDSTRILDDRHSAYKIAQNQGWQIRDEDYGLWIKKGKHEPNRAVTGAKVLFGDDAVYPVPSWHLCADSLNVGNQEDGLAPRLAFRLGRPGTHQVPKLKFKADGNFKIVQMADLHMSTGPGTCDHPVPAVMLGPDCKADDLTSDLMVEVLKSEKPDFVVFTGDQIYGKNAPDPETALLKALGPVIDYEIPFAVVWGNHDNQGSLDNDGLMNIVTELPFTVSAHGPEDLPGDGNYVVTVSPSNSEYPALTMYFLDSHAKLSSKSQTYDYIRPEQHDFVRKEYQEIHSKLEGYSHVPLSMAFFHIPLPEYRDLKSSRMGTARESVIAPVYNSGTLQALRELGVSVISVGHDHVNDFCQLQAPSPNESVDESVWLCYGGATGFGGYGGYANSEGDYKRRIRVFDIDMNLPYIDTWHRVQGLRAPQNRARLVDSGVARAPSSASEDEAEIEDLKKEEYSNE